MKNTWILALATLVGVVACVSDPVKKSKPGSIDVMTGAAGTTGGGTGAGGSSSAGGSGTTTGAAGDPAGTAGTGGDPAGAAGSGTTTDTVGAAGTTGAAGTGAAGSETTTGAAGSETTTGAAGAAGSGATAGAAGSGATKGMAGTTGAAGTTAAGGATGAGGAKDAGVSTPEVGGTTITDPCDHRTWTFTPSVVCTTTCAAMPDAMKLPANAIDADATTRYTTGITQGSKGPEVAILTFPKPVTLTGITLLSKNGDGPMSYLVESSLDGANFSFFNPSAMGAGSDNLVVTFPGPTKVLALRITQTGVKKTNWWSVHELTTLGCAAAK